MAVAPDFHADFLTIEIFIKDSDRPVKAGQNHFALDIILLRKSPLVNKTIEIYLIIW